MAQRDPHQLREEAASAVARGKLDVALALYSELESLEPGAAAWPKRVGETHRRLGDIGAAVLAFERAVDKYVRDGLLVQAIAVCKLILQLEPTHASTATRLSELAIPSAAEARAMMRMPRAPSGVHAGSASMTGAGGTPASGAPSGGHADMARRAMASAEERPVRRTASDPRRDPPTTRAELLEQAPPLGRTASRDELATPRTKTADVPAPTASRTKTADVPAPATARTKTADVPAPVARTTTPGVAPAVPTRATTSPAELAARAAKREATRRSVTIPPGGALDAIPLAAAMPDSQRVVRADGTDSGMTVLNFEIGLDELGDHDDDEVEIEIVDPDRVALLRTPVFSQLPQVALEHMIGKLALRELTNGEDVFREGEVGTTMYVIAEGEVTVTSHGAELARLGPGAFFGEIALVTDLPRSATVTAAGRVELLAIDRDVMREAAAEAPQIVSALLGFVRDRLVDRITRTSALFQPFTEDERAGLAARFELVEVDPSAWMIVQGERADGLYIVLAGRVEVIRQDEQVAIATLVSGDVFGEMSLMGAKGSIANVRALTRVLALRLPATIFQEVIMTYPQVLAYLGELTDSRSRLRQAEDILDLHIDLV